MTYMIEKEITTAIISDIHFGAGSPTKLFDELRFFLSYLQDLPSLDLIVIDGDYFDSKLYVQSTATKLAVYFMNLLVHTAKMKQAKIRIVYGTESHDAMQYRIFSYYETDTSLDFRVIYKVTEEEIFDDVYALYLPEEYVLDKKEYYMDFLNNKKKYDFVFDEKIKNQQLTLVGNFKVRMKNIEDIKREYVCLTDEIFGSIGECLMVFKEYIKDKEVMEEFENDIKEVLKNE